MTRLGLDVDAWVDGGRAVLELNGELDAYSAPALCEALDRLAARSRVAIVMGGVRFMDSSGLSALVHTANRARAAGGGLALVDADERILNTLRVTGLTRVMEPCTSLEQAFAWLDATACASRGEALARRPATGEGTASDSAGTWLAEDGGT